LFTFWIGLAIGRCVVHGKRLWPGALWGFVIAVATHLLWNASLSVGEIRSDIDEDVEATVIVVVAGLFVLLFVAVVVALVRMRNAERRRLMAAMPGLVLRYNIAPDEAALFTSWRGMLAARKRMPRAARPAFDAVYANLARLAQLHGRHGHAGSHTEQVLTERLASARMRLRQRVTAGR
jgi:hypothetical protein